MHAPWKLWTDAPSATGRASRAAENELAGGARRAQRFGVNHMARRCVPPPKLTPPILSLEQKRRCIERLRKCIQRLEIFDPEKAQNRFGQSEVLTLEMRIDNALSAAFGYGTPMYLRYNLAAALDIGPLITDAALHSSGLPAVDGPESRDAP
jgi:hypothetical protein